MSQKQIVLSHLRKNKSITSWFAIQNYGMTRLADIILRLRKEGHNIETKIMKHKNMRTGKTSHFAKYTYSEHPPVGTNYGLCFS